MKQLMWMFVCALAVFLLSVTLIRWAVPAEAADYAETVSVSEQAAETQRISEDSAVVEPLPVISPVLASYDARFHLPVLVDGELVSMPLARYVLGSVLGEMPTEFEPEALKAQAVACRTYALRMYTHRKHGSAAVCADPSCCMNWVDPDAYAALHGQDALARAEDAVQQTDGMAVFYDGEPICATFFSCSGGRTEDAEAVWGGAVPYLVSVDSPDEQAPYDTDTVLVSDAEFVEKLTAANEMADFSGDRGAWIGAVSRTNGGGIDTLEIGGCIYTGVQLRGLFGLRSTAFELALTDEGVRFTTHGFGHRVGLSQYGANAMAKRGCGYAEILEWYYTGANVQHG